MLSSMDPLNPVASINTGRWPVAPIRISGLSSLLAMTFKRKNLLACRGGCVPVVMTPSNYSSTVNRSRIDYLDGDNDRLRKARGAFFTPEGICRFVTDWAIRSSADSVLEPSCGEAAFLLAAADRLLALGGAPRDSTLAGVELHAASADRARHLLSSRGFNPRVEVGDFFKTGLARASFDVVVGNPPYVRFQEFSGAARVASAAAALAQGVRLTGLASSWAAFTIHAASFLRSDGRLGLVLPAELLSVNYAAEVRSFLLRRFARVRLVLFEERVFPGVTEEVVLLLAEGTGPTDCFEVYQVRDVADLSALNQQITTWRPGQATDKWLTALLPASARDVYETAVSAGDHFAPLGVWGSPTLGMVTGCNDFFAITAAQVKRLKLRGDEYLRISPPGSRHLRGLTLDTRRWNALSDAGESVYLFRPGEELASMSAGARAHIRLGEAEGIQHRYKCRIRRQWWRVPLVTKADLLFTYMNYDAPRLISNRASVAHLNSIHGLRVKPAVAALGLSTLSLAGLNSLTLLGAELGGRSYGGGILKVEPREANRLPVPSPVLLASISRELGSLSRVAGPMLAKGGIDGVTRLVDDLVLRQQMRLSGGAVDALAEARRFLFARRTSRKG